MWSFTGEVILEKGGADRVRRGISNIYVKWVKGIRGPISGGDLVVIKEDGETLGYGFYEEVGAIAVRVLSRSLEERPDELIRRRLSQALRRRELLNLGNFYRLVHSEADGLPGLIVDVYNDVAVISSTSSGFDRRVEEIASILDELIKPDSIFLKNDSRPRKEVNLPIEKRFIKGSKGVATIREGGALFKVDVVEGQKTGFFIDQRLNRIEIEELAGPDMKVLDLYSYTGGFAVHAALSGAKVTAVDESVDAVKMLRENSALNGVDVVSVPQRVKEFLESDPNVYDLIVVDPPALVPRKEMLNQGLRSYVAVNASVMEKVDSGLIFTSSCSQFVTEELFLKVLFRASSLTGKEFRILGKRGQSPDHPYDPLHPWTSYLKGFIIEIS